MRRILSRILLGPLFFELADLTLNMSSVGVSLGAFFLYQAHRFIGSVTHTDQNTAGHRYTAVPPFAAVDQHALHAINHR